jgi:hypothetical protein
VILLDSTGWTASPARRGAALLRTEKLDALLGIVPLAVENLVLDVCCSYMSEGTSRLSSE